VPVGQRVGALEQLDPTLALFGVNAQGEPLLVEPKGVAVGPDGRVYVSEGRSNRVTIFNQDGSIAGAFGRPGGGEGELAEPWGIAVAPNGDVFIADTWNHRVQKFAADGRAIAAWGGVADTKGDVQAQPGKFFGPRDVAIGPDGLVYVSDTGNKRIQVFDANGGVVRVFGGAGDQPGRFNEPVGLAFDGDTLLVADAWNGRVQRLDTGGNPLGSIPVQGWENRGVTNKPYIAAAPGGGVYVTLPERGEVSLVDASGQARPLARPVDRNGRLGLPTGIDVAPDGTVWVAESAGGAVSRYAGGPNAAGGSNAAGGPR
jgi:DNA-binding beta-propeller fold protein YncE